MSLYIRLLSGFWSHRKTMRLKSLIGEAALWVPPRLWSYAAESQPDGDFTDYTAEELAMLLGYSGDAQAMLVALQQASFLDGKRIHDWHEHNGYHERYADRAKKAARARWKKKRPDMIGKDKIGKETSIACSNACSIEGSDFDEFWQAYPKRVGKGNAEKAWKKLKCGPILPLILTKLRTLKTSADWTKEGGQFIPHPATWLNRKGWEDELSAHHKNGSDTCIRETLNPPVLRPPDDL